MVQNLSDAMIVIREQSQIIKELRTRLNTFADKTELERIQKYLLPIMNYFDLLKNGGMDIAKEQEIIHICLPKIKDILKTGA